MRNSIKVAALGVLGAGLVGGAIAGVRYFRARRAEQPLDLETLDIDAIDFGEPVIVAEEIVVVTEPFEADLEAVPAGGFQK
ncbi:MAG TPA: hypothetical protein VMZ53_02605 [Kofleriaceae bacterium]|nr:hypothetical protein [Kofleriaceae bacterium]